MWPFSPSSPAEIPPARPNPVASSPPPPRTEPLPLPDDDPLVRLSSSPWTAWSMSIALLLSIPASLRHAGGPNPRLPPFWQIGPFAGFFGLAGYMTATGDSLNGSGTASAWSLIYLFAHGRRGLFAWPPRPIPFALSSLAVVNGASHGWRYWSPLGRKTAVEEEADRPARMSTSSRG